MIIPDENYYQMIRMENQLNNEVPLIQIISDEQITTLTKNNSRFDDIFVPLPQRIDIGWIGEPDSTLRRRFPMNKYFTDDGQDITRIMQR